MRFPPKNLRFVTCDVCGEEGYSEGIDSWGMAFRHRDARVCNANLLKKLEAKEQELHALRQGA